MHTRGKEKSLAGSPVLNFSLQNVTECQEDAVQTGEIISLPTHSEQKITTSLWTHGLGYREEEGLGEERYSVKEGKVP